MDGESITTKNVPGMGDVSVRFINTEREFKWRLEDANEESEWSSHYSGILTHKFKNGRTFAVATYYWESILPIEVPFEIVEF